MVILNLEHHSLGVPYHSWRITHAKHHASTGHMTQDQVFVPPTRSQVGLPPLDSARENLLGSRVTVEVMKELREAIGDSPLGAVFGSASYLVRVSPFIARTNGINTFIARWMACIHHVQHVRAAPVPKGH